MTSRWQAWETVIDRITPTGKVDRDREIDYWTERVRSAMVVRNPWAAKNALKSLMGVVNGATSMDQPSASP